MLGEQGMNLERFTVELVAQHKCILNEFQGKTVTLPLEALKPWKQGNLRLISSDGSHYMFSISGTEDLRELRHQLMAFNSLYEHPGVLARLPFHPHRIPSSLRSLARRLWPKGHHSHNQGIRFPDWPVDYSVDFLRFMDANIDLNHSVYEPTLCLSHDVDSLEGQRQVIHMAKVEESLGLRSAWFLVPGKYPIDRGLWREMKSRGHEIGCHGWIHDFKLPVLSVEKIQSRLSRAVAELAEFEVCGFRAPGFYRSPRLYEQLPRWFSYDSSAPDTLNLPGPGGCGTVFVDQVGGLTQVPVTVSWDGETLAMGLTVDERQAIWQEKISWIKRLGGVIHLLTHPDPGFTWGKAGLDWYRNTLREITSDISIGHCLPREIARDHSSGQH